MLSCVQFYDHGFKSSTTISQQSQNVFVEQNNIKRVVQVFTGEKPSQNRNTDNIELKTQCSGPGNGSPMATNVVLVVVVVGLGFLLLSDFPFPKALSFLNRS